MPLPSGTSPENSDSRPQPGRFTIVSGEHERYLFYPEKYSIFKLPSILQKELENFDSGHFRRNIPEYFETIGLDKIRDEISEFLMDFESTGSNEQDEPFSSVLETNIENPVGQIEDLVIHVSQACNLACSYCYADDLNKINRLMSFETAEKLLSFIFKSSNGLNSIKFLGGEPTLAFPVMEYIVNEVKNFASLNWEKTPVFVTVTNGTKISDEMIDFFVLNRFYVLVSIDGQKEIHDKLRPFKGGRGSYDKVCTSIKRLIDGGCDLAIEAVYTKTHFDNDLTVNNIVDHFLSLGVREMQITLALGEWHEQELYGEIEEVCDDFVLASRRSIKSMKSTDAFLMRGIFFVVDGFFKKEKKRHVCGAGRTFMAVNYDGEAFPCYLIQNKQFSYGVLSKNYDRQKHVKISEKFRKNGKEHHPVCRQCWANEICQSCLGSTFLIKDEMAKPPYWFCALQKSMISAVLGELSDALNGNAKSTFIDNVLKIASRRKRLDADAH